MEKYSNIPQRLQHSYRAEQPKSPLPPFPRCCHCVSQHWAQWCCGAVWRRSSTRTWISHPCLQRARSIWGFCAAKATQHCPPFEQAMDGLILSFLLSLFSLSALGKALPTTTQGRSLHSILLCPHRYECPQNCRAVPSALGEHLQLSSERPSHACTPLRSWPSHLRISPCTSDKLCFQQKLLLSAFTSKPSLCYGSRNVLAKLEEEAVHKAMKVCICCCRRAAMRSHCSAPAVGPALNYMLE